MGPSSLKGAGPATAAPRTPAKVALERWLVGVWWRPRPGAAARALWPLSLVYRALAGLHRLRAGVPAPTPVPVVIVGNLVVGGAGKTPVVIALIQALRAAGRRPGVVSRGHGRRRSLSGARVLAVAEGSSAGAVGDEPLLIHRRTGAPVYVARQRAAALSTLCAAHPEVDVVVSDDGLQHHALGRVAEVIVFDDRGVGNGLLLPAGPLRQPLPHALPPHARVVYTGRQRSTPLPGTLVPRHGTHVVPLDAWSVGDRKAAQPLASLRGRRLTALAGIGAPEQFFHMLEAAGLSIDRLAFPDHADYTQAPWPEGTSEVITTEKDAVKLSGLPRPEAMVWVLPLDCELPDALMRDLLALLQAADAPAAPVRAEEPSR